MHTIAAISTPIGLGGISIVRLSGNDALKIASSVFFVGGKKLDAPTPRCLILGKFKTDKITEQCLGVYFNAPFSFTGEDVFEFQCHGGVKITELILQELISRGASLATEGEFTKRAFLNGKITLDQAEGIIDTINAESQSELKAANDLLDGKLKNKVLQLQNNFLELIAKIEVALDYPDEDLEDETAIDVKFEIEKNLIDIQELIEQSATGRLIKNGAKVLIVGKTNVGKSSLMNALLDYDRAIVTNVQGTTRDILEDVFVYKGVKFILMDTAGIRDSSDIVEKIGIEKAKKSIENADIILFVLDGSREVDKEDIDILSLLSDKKHIVLVNKCDLPQQLDVLVFANEPMLISAVTSENIEAVKEKLYASVFNQSPLSTALLLTNQRHIDALKKTLAFLQSAEESIKNNATLDLTVLDIKNAWLSIGTITGETEIEQIINTIFAKFCVGK